MATRSVRLFLLGLAVMGLPACGGSQSAGPPPPVNHAPTVDAGADQAVDEFSTVALSGSGSDTDAGDTLTFSWTQVSGTAVTLTNANQAAASFTAPDVMAASPEDLTFRLSVSDGSATVNDSVVITVNDIGMGANNPPIASAGPDQATDELVTVNLDGSGSSDPDGDIFSYAWVQTAGPAVTLAGANTAQPSFTSPDVLPGSPVTLTFELTVDDGSATSVDTVDISVSEALSMVTVAGILAYERPTRNAQCRGYNFNNITNMPIRRATVLLLDAANNVLDTTQTADDGSYAFNDVAANTDVRVRVRAELVNTGGAPAWEVYVRDNTSQTGVPLANRPIYEVQWGLFNTGIGNISNADFVATTGWGINGYTGTRAAAPLSILDAIAEGIMLIQSVDPTVDMGRLDAFWSVNNTLTDIGDLSGLDNGELPATFFISNPDGGAVNPSLFLLGDAVGRLATSSIDTDEFDLGVIQHEWGHYFEFRFSRSDSIGGTHFIPGTLEPRTAFGEGWGYGIAAIVGGDPVLCDTGAPASTGFALDIESEDRGTQGWFNEMSIATLIYDLFDTSNDAGDSGSVGFGPIYATMTGFERTTAAFTTLYSFGVGIRANVDPADIPLVDALLNRERVDTVSLDEWASNQATQPATWSNGKAVRDLLPVYTDLAPGGPGINICANDDQVIEQHGNKPGEWRFLRLTTLSTRAWTITAQASPAPPPTSDTTPSVNDRSDPDMYLYRDGQLLGSGVSATGDREVFVTPTLTPDTYTLAFQEWRYEDPQKANDYPSRVCFDITMN